LCLSVLLTSFSFAVCCLFEQIYDDDDDDDIMSTLKPSELKKDQGQELPKTGRNLLVHIVLTIIGTSFCLSRDVTSKTTTSELN